MGNKFYGEWKEKESIWWMGNRKMLENKKKNQEKNIYEGKIKNQWSRKTFSLQSKPSNIKQDSGMRPETEEIIQWNIE